MVRNPLARQIFPMERFLKLYSTILTDDTYPVSPDLDRIALADENPGGLGGSILSSVPPGDFI